MISIVIPTWNEEQNLSRTIGAALQSNVQSEIVVVDAGSSDGTCALADKLGAVVVQSPQRQRAAQMNLGAESSTGEILLFLHADTILPTNALDLIEQHLADKGIAGGGFTRRFDSPSLFLKVTCGLAEIRNRALGWFLGDQAMFVRRSVFLALGGFGQMDRFEDLDFSRRLARAGRLVTLRPPVLTSARRFEREGPLRRTVRDFLLTMRYLQGDPAAIAALPKHREHVA